jgi:hypothetical protein
LKEYVWTAQYISAGSACLDAKEALQTPEDLRNSPSFFTMRTECLPFGGFVARAIPPIRSGAPVPPVLPPQDGFLFLDQTKFAAAIAADVEPEKAAFMARPQVPWECPGAGGMVTKPGLENHAEPLSGGDQGRHDPAARERTMAQRAGSIVREVAGSHAIYVSKPVPVADIIEAAASG